MKTKFHCFYFCVLLLICLGAKSDELNCIRNIGGGFFDLTPLGSNKDIIIENVEQITPDTSSPPSVYLQFNICRFATKQCKSKFTFANLFATSTELDCIKLTNTTKYDSIEYKLLDSETISRGVQIILTGGDEITTTIQGWSPINENERANNPLATYQFVLNLHCNRDVEDLNILKWQFDSPAHGFVVDIESTHACPILTLDQVSQFIADNNIVFAVVGTILGLVIAFLGLKLFLPTLFIAGFVSGFFVALFTFFGSIITPDSRESTKWILLGFALLLGVAFGVITVKANKFGIFMIGAWLGTIISLLLYNAILYKIHTDPAEIVLIVTVVVLGALFGVLALKFYKHVIIISTSLGGSYAFVRSLSLVIGGFPNEIQLINQIQMQDYNFTVEWPFYVYMNAIFLMTLFSIWVQYKIKKRSEAFEIEFDAQYFKKIDI